MRLAVGRHLPLAHRLQQRTLRPRRGAVDLVGQHDIGEDRPPTEDELVRLAVVHAAAGDVGRQQVGRKLDAVEHAGQAAGDGLAHQRLAHAGHVLQQHVFARQERHDHQPHGVGLAEHHAGDVLLQQRDQIGRFVGHAVSTSIRSIFNPSSLAASHCRISAETNRSHAESIATARWICIESAQCRFLQVSQGCEKAQRALPARSSLASYRRPSPSFAATYPSDDNRPSRRSRFSPDKISGTHKTLTTTSVACATTQGPAACQRSSDISLGQCRTVECNAHHREIAAPPESPCSVPRPRSAADWRASSDPTTSRQTATAQPRAFHAGIPRSSRLRLRHRSTSLHGFAVP